MESPGKRSIRFGLQVSPEVGDVERVGREAEQLGFSVVSVADHIGSTAPPPLPVMGRLLSATSTIRVGSMVLNNDMRNPVQLAWDLAWLHNGSGGRVELGLGAGHTPHEYTATGLSFDAPAVRKQRLAESVEIITALNRGETVDFDGRHYTVDQASIVDLVKPMPLLIGGNGRALLSHAAVHADIIGLQGLGKTQADGHRHSVKFQSSHLEAQLETIENAAAGRLGPPPELQALVQVVDITDDRDKALAEVVERIEGLTMADAAETPYLAVGSVEELAQHLIACRDRWGISYFTVRSIELAPVMALVAELDQG